MLANFNNDNKGGEIAISPGQYTFECMLPDDLTISLKGDYGCNWYNISFVLEIIIGPDEFDCTFTVIKLEYIDLNQNPILRIIFVLLYLKQKHSFHEIFLIRNQQRKLNIKDSINILFLVLSRIHLI